MQLNIFTSLLEEKKINTLNILVEPRNTREREPLKISLPSLILRKGKALLKLRHYPRRVFCDTAFIDSFQFVDINNHISIFSHIFCFGRAYY